MDRIKELKNEIEELTYFYGSKLEGCHDDDAKEKIIAEYIKEWKKLDFELWLLQSID